MIHVRWKGRFGNHLFQASCANFLSKKFKQEISHDWKFILNQNKNFENKIRNKSIIVTNENIEEIFNNNVNEYNIILDDYFQTRFCIDKFIEFNSYQNSSQEMLDATFVHVRLGDTKNLFSLDYEYYKDAINLARSDNIIISSDSPSDEIVTRLVEEFDAVTFSDTEVNTILMGANCRNRVLSLGTFSWWIGFLGNIFWEDGIYTVSPNMNRVKKWHGDIFPMFNWKEI